MKKHLFLILFAAALAGCASKPPVAYDQQFCTAEATKDGKTRCTAWTFGPSRTQAAAFKHRRMPSPWTAPRM